MLMDLLEVVSLDVFPSEETLLIPCLYVFNDIMMTNFLEVVSLDVLPGEETLLTPSTLHTLMTL